MGLSSSHGCTCAAAGRPFPGERRTNACDHSPVWSLHYPSGEGSSWAKENVAEKEYEYPP